ncbi:MULTISPECIES: NADH-quinone oxidoreductase subunit NuoG [Ralstonia solanacearum species complex]|uniref:NADH-quinone oxidoreductase n=4 Tax=Ralstonia solanacearum species complex TaxID=3116862 RepID=A0A0S4VYZ3_RALSL|nr:NADH-quinone oxidoreductase subunit NuoG [Ralstonia pseudosolanacearum]CUV23143.1 putative nadh dehydrogenaseI(Chain g) oxidoreductase protein [Ralstonia solanacearum]MDO3506158.1 NADH-quinone oxidoreductase subunit NuoG [Ralstonia pseudosolanacearum]MDO3510488.1 NADH-quinone oxidoreductase subunit NuoG [Ralstonia pseudosolanacearum]MDO3535820.1 NADH-quinone oxidoreductase subunit NuoG [Ralstonia pseudosolanacearum]MDO3604707.1 NADH-quinone oxidoreductase subunit NuoG [Ralstonia pseudosolan
MVEIEIDGKKVEVAEGSLVMEAARQAGTYIPHFCYHRKLSIAANCRMCLVEVEKAPKALPACATPVTAGMKVFTNSEKAVKAQKSVMEFLLINHPLDCPICDQGGECQLQDLAVGYGKSESRYKEEKRVVFHKNVGPLISMEEMTRCIHCTRCVRFGQEVAGVMELGMLNRGEHSEITTFVGQTVDSELSGNMIDLCPVGALTSKPFRYSARTWELARRKSVSPHDGLGANVIVQTKNQRVMRVLPLENDAINECWLSDKDRFAYEGLNSDERLTQPMLKQGGQWQTVDWTTALEYVANGLNAIKRDHGAEQIGALASPHSTLEELFLLQKLVRGIGSDSVDFRLRQSDFSAKPTGAPWLGMPIADVSLLQRTLVVGAFLRKDHPLLAARLRQGGKKGAQLSVIGAGGEDLLMPATQLLGAPSQWLSLLSEVAVAIAAANSVARPVGTDGIEAGEVAKRIAASLASGERKAVFLGNAAVAHPQFSKLHALAQWVAQQTGATLGFLTEAANTVGGYIAGALPQGNGLDAAAMLAQPRRAYVILGAEPEFDSANPQQARAALAHADTVVMLSPFASRAAMEHADVLLPVAPFTETSGTYINCEGLPQSFNGVVRSLGDSRPAWKVLRVLGNLLGLSGFEYETSEAVRDDVLTKPVAERLSNATAAQTAAPVAAAGGIERLADVPIYHADPIVRRAGSLQLTAASRAAVRAGLPADLFEQLGLAVGDAVRVTQGQGSVVLPAVLDRTLASGVIRVPAATEASAQLGPMFGTVSVEKAESSALAATV